MGSGRVKCHYKWCLTRRPGYVNPHKYPYIWTAPITADPSLWLEFIKKLPPDHEELENLENVRLCHLHFEEHFIIKSNKFLVGEKVYEVPLHKWRLAPEAYPTIFTPIDQSISKPVIRPEKENSTLPQINENGKSTITITEFSSIQKSQPQIQQQQQQDHDNNNSTNDSSSSSSNVINSSSNVNEETDGGGVVPSISTMYDMVDIQYEELKDTANNFNSTCLLSLSNMNSVNNNTKQGLETPERNPDDYSSFNNEIEVLTTNTTTPELTNSDCIVIHYEDGDNESKALRRKRKQNFETTTYLTEIQEIPSKISKTTIPIVTTTTTIQIEQQHNSNDNTKFLNSNNEPPKNLEFELDTCYSNNNDHNNSSSSAIDKKSISGSQEKSTIISLNNDSKISKSSNLLKKPIPILPKIPIILPSTISTTTTTTTRLIPTYRKPRKSYPRNNPPYRRILPPFYRPIMPKQTVQNESDLNVNITPHNVVSSVTTLPQQKEQKQTQNINIKEQNKQIIIPTSNKKIPTIYQKNSNYVFKAHVNLCSTVAIKKPIKPLTAYDLSQLRMPTQDYAVNTYEHLFTISETVLSQNNVEIIRKSISLFCANWTMKFSLFSREVPRCSLGLCVSSIFDVQQVVNYFASLKICEGIDSSFMMMSKKQSSIFQYIKPLVFLHVDNQYRHLNCCLLRTVSGSCSFCTNVKNILQSKQTITTVRLKYPSVFAQL